VVTKFLAESELFTSHDRLVSSMRMVPSEVVNGLNINYFTVSEALAAAGSGSVLD
jgi:hypothetical protein